MLRLKILHYQIESVQKKQMKKKIHRILNSLTGWNNIKKSFGTSDMASKEPYFFSPLVFETRE